MSEIFTHDSTTFSKSILAEYLQPELHAYFLSLGSPDFDQVATVLLSTSMAVGGITGFILDNLLPGSLDERGLKQWKCAVPEGEKERERLASIHTYDIPFITPYLQRFTFVKYLPFLPYYDENGNGAQFANEDTSKQTSSL